MNFGNQIFLDSCLTLNKYIVRNSWSDAIVNKSKICEPKFSLNSV